MKKIIIMVCLVLAGYQFLGKPVPLSARTIDENCDAVVFTTARCPYCKQARNLLNKENVNWCEKDVNVSSANNELFLKLGGKGVPFAVIGDTVVKGYSANLYLSAIKKI